MKKMLTAFAVLALVLTGFILSAAGANPNDKVGVCHRTASDTNPYVYIKVPADEANGHITGTDKQHNENVFWKEDGTWRGTAHEAGDVKLDYFANLRSDCDDVTVPPTDDSTPTPDPEPTPPVVTEPPVIGDPPVLPPVINDTPKNEPKPHDNNHSAPPSLPNTGA